MVTTLHHEDKIFEEKCLECRRYCLLILFYINQFRFRCLVRTMQNIVFLQLFILKYSINCTKTHSVQTDKYIYADNLRLKD